MRPPFPNHEAVRVSHEAIYQALFVQAKGQLTARLVGHLRTGKVRRVRQAERRAGTENKPAIPGMVVITKRSPEVADRTVPGHQGPGKVVRQRSEISGVGAIRRRGGQLHGRGGAPRRHTHAPWRPLDLAGSDFAGALARPREGDLIRGKGNASAIATPVERTSRFVILPRLPHDHCAERVAFAFTAAMSRLPGLLQRSLTGDQGREMAQHAAFTTITGIPVFFCDPHSPWQRGTNEHTNGLLREYFPTGTDLSG